MGEWKADGMGCTKDSPWTLWGRSNTCSAPASVHGLYSTVWRRMRLAYETAASGDIASSHTLGVAPMSSGSRGATPGTESIILSMWGRTASYIDGGMI